MSSLTSGSGHDWQPKPRPSQEGSYLLDEQLSVGVPTSLKNGTSRTCLTATPSHGVLGAPHARSCRRGRRRRRPTAGRPRRTCVASE